MPCIQPVEPEGAPEQSRPHTALTQKPEFGSFGEAIGPYLAGRPEVRHVEAVG